MGQRNYWLAIISMTLVVGVISAFINNTATVAIFIPIVLAVAQSLDISPSKLLMPLSFASMFGGVCTLIGTSTNILVSSIAEQHGQVAFSMFEFAPLGLVFFIVGLAYLFFVGIRLIPERRVEQETTTRFEMNEYLTDVILEPGFTHFGQSSNESALTHNLDLDVVQVFRKDGDRSVGGAETILRPGDTLRIRGNAQEIRKLLARDDITLKPAKVWHDIDLEKGKDTLVEAIIAPDADVVGQELVNVDFHARIGALDFNEVRLGTGMSWVRGWQVRISPVNSLPIATCDLPLATCYSQFCIPLKRILRHSSPRHLVLQHRW